LCFKRDTRQDTLGPACAGVQSCKRCNLPDLHGHDTYIERFQPRCILLRLWYVQQEIGGKRGRKEKKRKKAKNLYIFQGYYSFHPHPSRNTAMSTSKALQKARFSNVQHSFMHECAEMCLWLSCHGCLNFVRIRSDVIPPIFRSCSRETLCCDR